MIFQNRCIFNVRLIFPEMIRINGRKRPLNYRNA